MLWSDHGCGAVARVQQLPTSLDTRRLSCPQQVTVLIHGSASPGCLAMQLPSPGFPHLHTVPEAKTTPARECTGPRRATSFDEDLSNLFDLTSLTKEPFKEDELFHVAAISHVNQKDFFLTATTLYPFPTKLFILIQLSSSLQWTPLGSIFQCLTDTLFNLNLHILFSFKRGEGNEVNFLWLRFLFCIFKTHIF